jgi:outer membrane protein
MVGVQLTMPLYTGGYRQAKYEESLQNHEKAKAEYDRITLEVERSLRQVWLALNTSKDRIRALADAKTVSQARLVATRNGHRVGSRSTLELLGAEVDAINSEQALFVEQTQYLLNRLRLSALTSDLGEADLKIVNAYLK